MYIHTEEQRLPVCLCRNNITNMSGQI